MSITGLFNQTLSFYLKSSYNAYGREVIETVTEVSGRVQETSKRKLLPNGSMLTIDAIAYVPGDTVVNLDDRVDVGTTKYKVIDKYCAVDGNGQTHHIKLNLIKWRET
jgi:hypothetical protein